MTQIWNDTIDQGATFYRVVTVYSDKAKTLPTNITGKTPRSALMDNGHKVADMPCSIIDAATGELAWTMPRSATSTLSTAKTYNYFIYLDNPDNTTDPVQRGQITVNPGLPVEPA